MANQGSGSQILHDSDAIDRIVREVLRRLEGQLPHACPQCGCRLDGGAAAPAEARAPVSPRLESHGGRLLSEDEVLRYHRAGVRALELPARCLVTPAARDRARDLKLDLICEGGKP